jgi:hypothetical protein
MAVASMSLSLHRSHVAGDAAMSVAHPAVLDPARRNKSSGQQPLIIFFDSPAEAGEPYRMMTGWVGAEPK